MNTDIRQRTISGLSWSATSQVVNQVFTFAISIVLARLLGPKVYGLIGMITVFTGFAGVFGDLALGAAIIQRKELEPRHLNAAFWVNVTMGATLTLLMVALAPVVAWFYKEPLLLPLTAVIALKYFIDSLSAVKIAMLNREMRFRTLAKIQIGSSIISGLAGLGMALYGMGPWSLVAQTMGGAIVSTVIAWCLVDWHPRFSFEFRICKELFGFSAYVLAFDIFNYWARTMDQLLIGRFIGSAGLGVYSRAYSLMLMPLTQVSRVAGRVMFPALSSIQDDKPRSKRIYLRAISIIGLVTFPMMTGAFAVSDHLILALLGDKWVEVIPIFKIYCWVGLLQSIWTTIGWIYQSQGRTGLYFTMGIGFIPLVVLAFFIGIRWGIIGMAWSYFAANLIWCYPSCTVAFRVINLTFWEMLRSLSPVFFCAVTMSIAVWSLELILPVGMAHWQYLAIQIPFGMLFYLTFVVGLRLDSWREGSQALSEMTGGHLKSFNMFFQQLGFLPILIPLGSLLYLVLVMPLKLDAWYEVLPAYIQKFTENLKFVNAWFHHSEFLAIFLSFFQADFLSSVS